MTRRLRFAFLLAVAGWTISAPVYAYVELAHQAITRKAFDRLQIDFLSRFGVPKGYEVQNVSLSEWMANGAYDEDALPRPVNHFFDPVHLKPLRTQVQGCFFYLWERADQRAVGETGYTYSIEELKDVYRVAVLGSNPGTRQAYLKELFFGLGHVVHLVQDMAQPEHTRNDQHLAGFDDTDASGYEEWGKVNLIKEATSPVSFGGYPNVKLPDYKSFFHTDHMKDGRPAGKGLADYSNLNFVTQDTNYHDEDPDWQCSMFEPDLKGCDTFTEPKIEEAVAKLLTNQKWMIFDIVGGWHEEVIDETVFTSTPRDRYQPTSTATDDSHTYLSSIDHERQRWACTPHYSLAAPSYLSRAKLLVPRAVGYSAGIIEHLFRGSIDATFTSLPNFPDRYNIKLTNLSMEPIGADAAIKAVYMKGPGQSSSDDTTEIVDDTLAGLIEGFGGLAPGQSTTIYNIPVAGISAEKPLSGFERRLVITGTLGEEENAVIGLVQPAGGLRVHLESSLDLVRMSVFCGGISGYRRIPTDYQSQPPVHDIFVSFKPGDTCRVWLEHMEPAKPGFEGTPVTLNLKVWRTGLLVEDLYATIDGSDLAVAGSHTATSSRAGDRSIYRYHNCSYLTFPNYQCQVTVQPWN